MDHEHDHEDGTVSEGDPSPSGPHGVDKGGQRGGEEVAAEQEAGRHDTGDQGSTGRPTGESSMRDSTSVDPQEPIDDDSPTLPPA